MDPNENLRETRTLRERLSADLNGRGVYGSAQEQLADMERLCELNGAMDQWLIKGGYLPAEWAKNREADTETVKRLVTSNRTLDDALKALIDECLSQGDSRKPRPALAKAIAARRPTGKVDDSATIKVGDRVEYKLFSGFPMEVLEVAPCEPPEDHGGAPEHDQYRVIDPEGQEDWLCARTVRKVGA